MKRTHLSLYYLTAYLLGSGIALIAVPDFALKLLFSNGNYGDVIPRLVGILALALGLVVLQIVRHHVQVLYTTLLGVRGILIVLVLGLYFYSHDPFFISLFLIVALGVALTGVSYWLDRQNPTVTVPSKA